MSDNFDIGKKNTLIDILKLNNEEYSHVTSLDSLMIQIINLNDVIKKNFDYFTTKNNKDILDFKQFLSKSIICFLNNQEQTFNDFIYSVRLLKEVNINCGFKMYDLIAKSMQEIFEKETDNNLNLNYIQMSGLKTETLGDNRNVLKNYTNRLLINKNFELLRLLIGDAILNYFLSQTSMFIYEEKFQNFIQVTGPSLKSKLLVLLKATPMEKYVSAVNSSTYYSQKNFMFLKSNVPQRKEDENKTIPIQTFNVERTKIYYCSNFNRKLGFFKNSMRNLKNKKESNLEFVYNRMFDNYTRLIPSHIEDTLKSFVNEMLIKIEKYNFPKILFKTCKNMKNWKEKKREITNKIKNNLPPEDLNKDLQTLLSLNVEYKNVFKFITRFLSDVVPKELVGLDNFKIIFSKLKTFVELNRFETFNKTSLFDLKEFSFKHMKWLEFKSMRKDTYEIFGIKLKNFIMKNIIFWIFDFLVVQLIRSHFYVTEKQGHNYKTFYYHKTVWDLIIKINEIKLSSQFEIIQGKENVETAMKRLKKMDLIFGKVRLMPKPLSCRPIVSYKKRTLGTRSILKILLFETQKVFKYISCKMQAKKDSCVVFDHKTIVQKLKDFKEILLKETKNSEITHKQENEFRETNKLIEDLKYFAMDIEACYDNIDINKLISILDNDDIICDNFVSNVLFVLLPKPHILKKIRDQNLNFKRDQIEKMLSLNPKENPSYQFEDCFEVKKLFFISELNEYIHFLDFLQNKNDLNYSNCILYQDYQNMSYLRKEQFIPRIKSILTNNIIKFNKKFFKQKKGIPQGLSVSSFLCNLYFYNIEKELSQRIYHKIDKYNKNLLMRFMDDYLCISNKEAIVKEFVTYSKKMANDNKFNFNTKKSKSNVQNDSKEENSKFAKEIYLIDDYDVDYQNSNGLISIKNKNDLTNGSSSFITKSNYVNTNNNPVTVNKLFNWNGINFELNKENYFNILIYSKEDFDIKKYYSSININLPIVQNKSPEFSWLFKKINSIFLTGHPWIYFVSSINDTDSLIRNMEDVCKVVAFKLIYLCSVMSKYQIQPGQNSFIDIIDASLKKLYFYFSDKLVKHNNCKFFLDFEIFYSVFYGNIYKLYYNNGEINHKLIDFCPYFFKCIRRKIMRLASR